LSEDSPDSSSKYSGKCSGDFFSLSDNSLFIPDGHEVEDDEASISGGIPYILMMGS
jgi:hypothetical protein